MLFDMGDRPQGGRRKQGGIGQGEQGQLCPYVDQQEW